MDDKYRCRNCEFWEKSMGCKRYPEIKNKRENDWCGEHSEYRKELIKFAAESLISGTRIFSKEPEHGKE